MSEKLFSFDQKHAKKCLKTNRLQGCFPLFWKAETQIHSQCIGTLSTV